MNAVGIVRKIDQLGRIVIPMEIRRQNGIADGDGMEILPTTDGIIIRKCSGQKKIAPHIAGLRDAIRVKEGIMKEERMMLIQQVAAIERDLSCTERDGETEDAH